MGENYKGWINVMAKGRQSSFNINFKIICKNCKAENCEYEIFSHFGYCDVNDIINNKNVGIVRCPQCGAEAYLVDNREFNDE